TPFQTVLHDRINQREGALLQKDLDAAFSNLRAGTMFQLPAQNPTTGKGLEGEFQVRDDPSKNIWFQVKHLFSGIDAAPGNGGVESRNHSANPNAPAGSYSQPNPTTQVNSRQYQQIYMLPDGTWKHYNAMPPDEKAAIHFPKRGKGIL